MVSFKKARQAAGNTSWQEGSLALFFGLNFKLNVMAAPVSTKKYTFRDHTRSRVVNGHWMDDCKLQNCNPHGSDALWPLTNLVLQVYIPWRVFANVFSSVFCKYICVFWSIFVYLGSIFVYFASIFGNWCVYRCSAIADHLCLASLDCCCILAFTLPICPLYFYYYYIAQLTIVALYFY